MAEWWDGPMCLYDCETTGVDVEFDRIVTATVVRVRDGGAAPESWLINPGMPIPEGASAIHGVTTEHAKVFGSNPALVLPEVADRLRTAWKMRVPVVGFNIAYDLSILDRELRRYGLGGLDPAECAPVVDPFVLDKQVDPYRRGSRKLGDVCAHYGVRLDGAHDATQDALAAGRLAWKIARSVPAVAVMSLDELHGAQVKWKRAQADGLREFWVSRGDPRASGVDGSWPIRPFEGGGR